MRIVILGAAGTGKSRLASALTRQLAAPSCEIIMVAEATALQAGSTLLQTLPQALESKRDLTLLLGLDQPVPPHEAQRRAQVDDLLRQALQQSGQPFTVLYGSDTQRATQALRLIHRQQGQPSTGQNEDRQEAARWVWVCDKCSDPVCEHRLFTDKLGGTRN